MKTMLAIAVASALLALVPSSADAQQRSGSRFITRTTVRGETKILPLPSNRAECLANRTALGYNIKKQGGGRCNRLFPE